ncbi:MAG: sulfotransferase family protein [Acidimicrobiia bacterium]
MSGPVRFLIVGTPRSGTTLVQRLACELPGVGIPYETHFFTKGVEVLTEGHARPHVDPFDPDRLRAALTRYAALPHLEGAHLDVDAVLDRVGPDPSLLDLFDAVVATMAGDAPVLGEKTPGHLHWAAAIAQVRPELRVIGVVRDPRAAIASQRAVPWGSNRVDVASGLWVDDQRTLAALADRLGDRMIVLRYEDVAAEPGVARTAIAGLLGLREPEGATGAGQSPSGSLRLPWETWKESVDAPIGVERVDAWREALTVLDAARVRAECSPMLERFGYGDLAPGAITGPVLRATMGRHIRRRRRNRARRRDSLRAIVAGTRLD